MRKFAMIAALIGTASVLQAQSAPPVNIALETGSKLWFDGTSNVKDFHCTAGALTSLVTTNGSAVATAKVTVPVAKLECGNGKMNEHMKKALKMEQFPNVEFTLNSYTVEGAKALLKGTLIIGGTTKNIQIPATIQQDGRETRVKATKVIDMTEWSVKPPSLMMGAMKVKQLVTIGFDVTVKP